MWVTGSFSTLLRRLDIEAIVEFTSATESDKEYFRSLNRACYEEVVSQQFGPWNEALQNSNFEAKWKEQTFEKGGQKPFSESVV